MQSLKVEPLTYADLVWFAEVAATNMLLEELKRPELYNLGRIYELSQLTITQGTSWVVKDGLTPVGAIAGLAHPNLFNPSITTLTELIWYVLPEFRNGRAGALLIQAFDKRAPEIADEASLSILPTSDVNFQSMEKRGWLLREHALHKKYKDL